MADSKTFSGFPVQNLSSDSTSVGQIYYNSTSGSFKAVTAGGVSIGTWASGGNMPGNYSLQGSFGTRDATITGGGSGPGMGPPGYGAIGLTYNGTSWSEISEINTLRSGSSGFGVSTSGLIGGGYTNVAPDGNKAFVESWNGSAWSEVADISSNRTNAGTAGTYTAGLLFGGSVAPVTAVNESWNGSAWTEVGDLNTARTRSLGQSVGTQTAAMMIGGEGVTVTEQWNGSSWTEVNELNTPREIGGGNGIVTAALAVSGRLVSPNAISALVEAYDGTSWTEVNDVSTGRVYTSATGTGSGNNNQQSLFYGGATSGSTANTTATEEFAAVDFVVKTLTTS